MARDSSPFAQRLKALASRATRPTSDDSAESAAQQGVGEPATAPADATPLTHSPAAIPAAEVDPDEQPTGEFPAIAESDVSPAPSDPALPSLETSAPADLYAPEPNFNAPPATPDPASIAADQAWSTPNTDAFGIVPSSVGDAPDPSALSDDPPPVPFGDAPVPSSDSPVPPDPTPAWPVVVPPPPVKPPTSVPAPGYEPPSTPAPPIPPQAVRPIWLDPPSEPAAPNAGPSPQPAAGAAEPTPSGPTLQPPVLPKKEQPEAEPSSFGDGPTDEPIDSAPVDVTPEAITGPIVPEPFGDVPDATSDSSTTNFQAPESFTPDAAPEPFTPEPFNAEPQPFAPEPEQFTPELVPDPPAESTPAALNDALALPDDEDYPEPVEASTAEGTADETGSADLEASAAPDAHASEQTGDDETQPTLISDAVAEPPKRLRLTRPGFLKRGGADASESVAETPAPSSSPDEAVLESAAESVDDEPATTQFQAASEPGTTHFGAVPEAPTTDAPDLPDEVAAAAASDPGSITSRFRLGRRKAKKDDAAQTNEAALAATADSPEAPTAEPGPEPEPALLTAQPVPYKPSFSERAALRRRAKSLRGRRDAGLLELGAIVLDQSRFGDPSGGTLVRRRTSELADLDSEIAAIEIALDDERSAETVKQLGVVHCTSCSALLGPADRFCANCGSAHPGPGDAGTETAAS